MLLPASGVEGAPFITMWSLRKRRSKAKCGRNQIHEIWKSFRHDAKPCALKLKGTRISKMCIRCWMFAIVKTRHHSQSFSLRPMWLIYRIAEQGCLVDAFNSGYWYPINGTWKRLSIDGLITPEAPGNFCASQRDGLLQKSYQLYVFVNKSNFMKQM